MSIFSLHSTVVEDHRDFVRLLFGVFVPRSPYPWDETRLSPRAELETWLVRAYKLDL
jgi:hypothetical protein